MINTRVIARYLLASDFANGLSAGLVIGLVLGLVVGFLWAFGQVAGSSPSNLPVYWHDARTGVCWAALTDNGATARPIECNRDIIEVANDGR